MSALHAWHRETFAKTTEVTLQPKHYSGQFGGTFPQGPDGQPLGPTTREIKSARAVVCQRVVNGMSPAEWKAAQEAFDASHEGLDLHDEDAGVRRNHCEVWLLKSLFEADHAGLPAASEPALLSLLEHHAGTKALELLRADLVASVTP